MEKNIQAYSEIEKNVLESYSNWTGNEATEEGFNEWIEGTLGDLDSYTYLDSIFGDISNIQFDYVTWFCDHETDDSVIQVTLPLKGGMSIILDSYESIPFSSLAECVVWIAKINGKIAHIGITDYTDVSGEKTQIIIDHNK